MITRISAVIAFLTILAVGLYLRDGAVIAYAQNADHLTGTVSLSGAWAIYPLAVKWSEAFRKLHPNVQFDISAGGAGKGMTDALSGSVDIGMVSREIDKAELAKGAFPIYIAKDAVFPTASANNPAVTRLLARGITIRTFTDIFITGRVTSWKQVAGGADAPVHVYTRADACGAASAWAATLDKKYKQDHLRGIGVYGDPGLLEAVRRDPLGLGYNNLGFVFAGDAVQKGIILVPIDANKNGKVDADERIDSRDKAYQAIAGGVYPGVRREYFVSRGKPTGAAKAFIDFALSAAGTKVLEKVGGYVPLSADERAEQLKRF